MNSTILGFNSASCVRCDPARWLSYVVIPAQYPINAYQYQQRYLVGLRIVVNTGDLPLSSV